MTAKWIFPPDRPQTVRRLTDALRISSVTARLLVNRGLTEPSRAQQFLQPSLHDLVDPPENGPLSAAAGYLTEAAETGRRITVYGDYDADGICAAALLLHCFDFLGAEADLYIPHRVEEGYGLRREALEQIADRGTDVVVTVDCGISATEEAERARELGMDLVITDHHPPKGETPAVGHVLNTKLEECGFGYEYLSGVGVAFKLMWAVGRQLSRGSKVSEEFRELMLEAMGLVAVGTVADMVPLLEENRTLVRYGIKTLATSRLPGLQALMSNARVKTEYLSARDIGYRLAPRLNAAGRMGHALSAVELLTTADAAHAAELAEQLDRQNRRRRNRQDSACEDAEARLLESDQLERPGCILLSSPDWHQGVVGLVASRLCERFWRPAFVFTENGDLMRGSARSIPGFALHRALAECADLLIRYGGHEGAAGLSLQTKNLPQFADRINELARKAMGEEPPTPELALDTEVELDELNMALVDEINALEPFGQGNRQPLLAATGLRLAGNPTLVGSNNRHLTFMARQGNATLRTIAMGKADWIEELRERRGETFSLAFEPTINRFRGRVSVELRAKDLQWDAERNVGQRG